jgi:hypothetical protein
MGIKITAKHYQFWCEHKTKVSWYKSPKYRRPVSIHELIPFLDPIVNKYSVSSMLIHLLKSYRRQNKDLKQELLRIAKNPGTIIQPVRRSRYAQKWVNRLKG